MRIFTIVPLIDGKCAVNKAGDKKIRKLLEDNFENKQVILLPRSKSRRALHELYCHKIIFMNNEDPNFIQLINDKKEFMLQEIKDYSVF